MPDMSGDWDNSPTIPKDIVLAKEWYDSLTEEDRKFVNENYKSQYFTDPLISKWHQFRHSRNSNGN